MTDTAGIIQRTKDLLAKEKDLSPALKASITLLLLLVETLHQEE